jgi:hypothetical protein
MHVNTSRLESFQHASPVDHRGENTQADGRLTRPWDMKKAGPETGSAGAEGWLVLVSTDCESVGLAQAVEQIDRTKGVLRPADLQLRIEMGPDRR